MGRVEACCLGTRSVTTAAPHPKLARRLSRSDSRMTETALASSRSQDAYRCRQRCSEGRVSQSLGLRKLPLHVPKLFHRASPSIQFAVGLPVSVFQFLAPLCCSGWSRRSADSLRLGRAASPQEPRRERAASSSCRGRSAGRAAADADPGNESFRGGVQSMRTAVVGQGSEVKGAHPSFCRTDALGRVGALRCARKLDTKVLLKRQKRVGQILELRERSSLGRAATAQSAAFHMSPIRTTDPFTAWRDADARAREAEASVLNASLRALDGLGGPPTLAERAEAKALRERADKLLEKAFAEVSTRDMAPSGTRLGDTGPRSAVAPSSEGSEFAPVSS